MDSDVSEILNPKAAERSRSSNFERTNEFLVKVALMRSLPPTERFPLMLETFRELLIRISKAELRISELEEKLL